MTVRYPSCLHTWDRDRHPAGGRGRKSKSTGSRAGVDENEGEAGGLWAREGPSG